MRWLLLILLLSCAEAPQVQSVVVDEDEPPVPQEYDPGQIEEQFIEDHYIEIGEMV